MSSAGRKAPHPASPHRRHDEETPHFPSKYGALRSEYKRKMSPWTLRALLGFKMSSSSHRKCPHYQFRQDMNCLGDWETPISTFLENASTCVDCSLTLQIIEALKPGWVEQHKKTGLVDLSQHRAEDSWSVIVPQVTVGIWLSKRERQYGTPLEESFSFHFVQRSTSPVYQRNLHEESENHIRRCFAQSLDVIESSGSSAAFHRARRWLSHCVEHDKVCQPPNSGFIPRRLIDVGSWDGSREPFLFEPTNPVTYACLSYCWGKDTDQVLTTTTENVQSHYKKLKLASLPLTIQDAISVCRGLKIPNLWVDSLCIIQDDRAAWLHDASTMRDVYHNSHITIAVLEPNSCKLGFLGKQQFGDPSWQRVFRPNVLAATDKRIQLMELLVRPRPFEPRTQSERSSLDQRGWCLQESLLPNRRLSYDGKEMTWDCICRQICECGHVVEPQVPHDTSSQYAKMGASLKIPNYQATSIRGGNIFSRRSLKNTPYHRWRDLVSDYSHRSLTKKHDKLRAISALAKVVRDKIYQEDGLIDEYVAGLWKSELHFGLTWQVMHLKENDEAPESGVEDEKEIDYCISSWSWASVERPVIYKLSLTLKTWTWPPTVIELCHVESVDCQQELPEDPTSAVIKGSLFLKAPFSSVKLISRADGKSTVVQSSTRRKAQVILDRPEMGVKAEDYYCLRLFTFIAFNRPNQVRKGPQTWFLVLVKSTRKEDAFERIGVGVWDEEYIPCPLFENVESTTVEII